MSTPKNTPSNPNSNPNSNPTSKAKDFDPRNPFADELTACQKCSEALLYIRKGFRRGNALTRIATWWLRRAMYRELDASIRAYALCGKSAEFLSPDQEKQLEFWSSWIRVLYKEVLFQYKKENQENNSKA